MSDGFTLVNIGKFSLLCLRATFGFGGAWLFARMAVPGFELFIVFALIWAAGGTYVAGQALHHLVKMCLNARKMSAFKRKGVDPKADPVAKDADLKAKGLTR